MSEIQEAAEIITSAVSPDANIIFGATLKPELEDELIITVIATGFDSAYYNDEAAKLEASAGIGNSAAVDEAVDSLDNSTAVTSNEDAAAHFADDSTTNIWDQPAQADDDDDTPAFLRRRKKKEEKE